MEAGEHNPEAVNESVESLLLAEDWLLVVSRMGELGRLLCGEARDIFGLKVKRNSRADSCQKALLEVNMFDHPSGVFSSIARPTDESSDIINPILSSFCIKLRPRSTPSLLTCMRQSAFGFPASGVFFEAAVVIYGDGSD